MGADKPYVVSFLVDETDKQRLKEAVFHSFLLRPHANPDPSSSAEVLSEEAEGREFLWPKDEKKSILDIIKVTSDNGGVTYPHDAPL